MLIFFFIQLFNFVIFGIFAQTIFFVDSNGSDNSSCGPQTSPCATLNQIFINYPGVSCTVTIGSGIFPTSVITLQRDAYVIFQGDPKENITITASWTGSFISNSAASGFEFHDVSIVLSGGNGCENFATLKTTGGTPNNASFYNVILVYDSKYNRDIVDIDGGSLLMNNLTLNGATLYSYFIFDNSTAEDTFITIAGSLFTNLNIGEDGALFGFAGHGPASVLFGETAFINISANYLFIAFWGEGTNQTLSMTNCVFNNSNTYLPPVLIEIEDGNQCSVLVQNTSWNNSTASIEAGAIAVLGSDDGRDNNFTFTGLKITNSSSPYVGGLVVAYNTLNISSCSFGGNRGGYVSDVYQELDTTNTSFKYDVVDCCSDSSLPRAGAYGTDISDLFPDCTVENSPLPRLAQTKTKNSSSPPPPRTPTPSRSETKN